MSKETLGLREKILAISAHTRIELNNHSKITVKFSGKEKRKGALGNVRATGNHASWQNAMPSRSPRQTIIRKNLRRFSRVILLPRLLQEV